MFQPEVFRTVLKKVLDIFGTFWRPLQSFGVPAVIRRPNSDSAPGKLCPPRYSPAYNGVRRKFPKGGQVSSQSCDVINQL